jgi:hypothetical protein
MDETPSHSHRGRPCHVPCHATAILPTGALAAQHSPCLFYLNFATSISSIIPTSLIVHFPTAAYPFRRLCALLHTAVSCVIAQEIQHGGALARGSCLLHGRCNSALLLHGPEHYCQIVLGPYHSISLKTISAEACTPLLPWHELLHAPLPVRRSPCTTLTCVISCVRRAAACTTDDRHNRGRLQAVTRFRSDRRRHCLRDDR